MLNAGYKTIRHDKAELSKYSSIMQQSELRKKAVLDAVMESGIPLKEFKAVIGRGGLLKPLKSGTYRINRAMIDDLKSSVYGEHASNLSAIIANEIAAQYNMPSFITDPVVVDEMEYIAKITGVP